MKKALTIVAASALALGAAACNKAQDSSANVSSEDNMLVPADENGMGGDANAVGGDNMMGDNSTATDNSSNAM